MTNPDPAPSRPAALIILISTVGFALVSKLLLPSLGLNPMVTIAIWIIWILLTAWYLVQTNNARIARLYLMVMFGMMLFIWLAIYVYSR